MKASYNLWRIDLRVQQGNGFTGQQRRSRYPQSLINLRTSLRFVSLPPVSVLSILILVSQRLYNDFFGGLGYRTVLLMVAAGGSVTSSGES
jgi:hypothetical protein